MNKVFLLGNVGADPELRFAETDTPLLKLRLATTERYRDKEGEWQDRTDWHNVTVRGKRAAALAKFLGKGERIMVEGRIETRSYQDTDGRQRWFTEVRARDVYLTGARRDVAQRLGAEELPIGAMSGRKTQVEVVGMADVGV
jgi:single-strand DNA-binding protein